MHFLITFLVFFVFCFSQSKQLHAIKLNTHTVEIDGQIEQVWHTEPLLSGFKQREPTPFAHATIRTEFQTAYDNKHVYFLVKAYQKKLDIVTQVGKRDQSNENTDFITIYIDPLNDKTSGYQFSVNPSNIQSDARIFDNGESDSDWDAVWESATTVDNEFWIAEIKIPLKALKFQSKDVQTWGMNVGRFYKKNNEEIYWQSVDPNKGLKVSNFASLVGLEQLERSSELFITPSIIGTFNHTNNYNPAEHALGALDLRYNVDQQHSIVATLKPDFAQIEADEDVINFTEYPDDLREKRAFFLEGNELYSMNDEVYYTRRMAKPDAGIKFIGSHHSFKYGLMYVRNEAESKINGQHISHKENILLPVVRYMNGTTLDLAYINGMVDSEYKLSGMLHAFNARYTPNDHLLLNTLLATTQMKENSAYSLKGRNKKNLSARLQLSYNVADYKGRLRYQKKTNDFEQGLIGEWELNNVTEYDYSVHKTIRVDNSVFRSVMLSYTASGNGTYDNKGFYHRNGLGVHLNMTSKSLGDTYVNLWFKRNVGDFRYRNFKSDVNETIHRDNFGTFVFKDNTFSGYNFRINTDYSKPFAIKFMYRNHVFRQSDWIGYYGNLQIRPNNKLRFELIGKFTDLKGSALMSRAFYRSLALKSQISFSDQVHLKSYNQFNSQSRSLSNNFVLSYEFLRGNFLYVAYTEIGEIDKEYTEGSLINDYRLKNRTLSMKCSYTLNL